MTQPFLPVHTEHQGEFHVAAALEQVLSLFTPLGETQWAHGWDPEFCYPASGLPAVGAVFLTTHADEPTTIWVMSHYAPETGQISYARITPHLAAGTVTIQCTATTPGTTTVHVAYHMTALSEAGNVWLTTFAQAHDQHWALTWEAAIQHYLHTRPASAHP